MIDGMQIRAARAMINWSQTELANRSSSSLSTVADIEAERRRGGTQTVSAIQQAFEKEGVFFTKSGVEKRDTTSYSITGDNWWPQVLEDVYLTLLDKPTAEVLLLCADDRESSPDVVRMWKKIRNAGIAMRQLVREENTYLLGGLEEYRWMPKEYFNNNVTMIYGDKVCLCADDNTKAVIFKDKNMARAWGNVFELLWNKMEIPHESTATERF